MLRSYRTQLCLVTINNIRLPINNVGIKTAIFNQGYTNKSLTVFDSNFRVSDITMFSVTPITIAPHRTEAMLYMTLTFPSQLMTSAVMNINVIVCAPGMSGSRGKMYAARPMTTEAMIDSRHPILMLNNKKPIWIIRTVCGMDINNTAYQGIGNIYEYSRRRHGFECNTVIIRHHASQSLQSLLGTHAGKTGTHVAKGGIRVIWEGLTLKGRIAVSIDPTRCRIMD